MRGIMIQFELKKLLLLMDWINSNQTIEKPHFFNPVLHLNYLKEEKMSLLYLCTQQTELCTEVSKA